MSDNPRLPVIVQDYIASMNDPKNTKNQRDIACLMLENIVSACQKAINNYQMRSERHR